MELATSRPRFRTDLVAECIEAEGQRFIDVIDPDTGDAFRFYEVEYSLACAMDGERDLAGLVEWAREELGIEPTRAELETVISTLGHLGYLEHAPAAQAAAAVAARGRGDDEFGLQHGVASVPQAPRAPVRGDDVELGMPGTGAPRVLEALLPPSDVELGDAGGKATARMDSLSSDDVELGSPGFAEIEPVATLRRSKTRPDQDDDGPTHLPPAAVADFDDEVSVDLSEHLSLRPDDVKEAVRMSRSMKAVEVPPELLEELGEKEAQIAARASEGSTAAATSMGEAAPVPTPTIDARPEPGLDKAADPAADKRPIELPDQPVVVTTRVDKKLPEPPAKHASENPIAGNQPSGGTSTVLIVLLVLAILGAGAFFVWKYILDKPPETGGATSTSSPRDPGKVTEPRTAGSGKGTVGSGSAGHGQVEVEPPPTATLAAVPGDEATVTGGKGGVVFFAVAAGTVVAAGDPIIKYQGVSPLEKKLGTSTSGLTWDIEKRYPKEIEKATTIRDLAANGGQVAVVKAQEAKIKERTKRLAEKTREAEEIQAKIDALTVTAPIAGTVSSPVAVGKRVGATDVVAKIGGGPGALVAIFDVAAASSYPVDSTVQLASKDRPEQSASCAVAAVEGARVTVRCPPDIELAAGSIVVLE